MSIARVVLDTNIVSYLLRGGALAEAYAPHVEGRLAAISFVTVGEMYYGAEKASGVSGGEKNSRPSCGISWSFPTTVKLPGAMPRSCANENGPVIPLRRTTLGLPRVLSDTARRWSHTIRATSLACQG